MPTAIRPQILDRMFAMGLALPAEILSVFPQRPEGAWGKSQPEDHPGRRAGHRARIAANPDLGVSRSRRQRGAGFAVRQ